MNDISMEIARGVEKRIKSSKVALQFVLEELEEASRGNDDTAVTFSNKML